jgi:hypothetical protein
MRLVQFAEVLVRWIMGPAQIVMVMEVFMSKKHVMHAMEPAKLMSLKNVLCAMELVEYITKVAI